MLEPATYRSVWLRLALLIGSFVALSIGHAVVIPIFEGPDEVDNLHYIRHIDFEGQLATPTAEMTYELENMSRGILPPLWFVTMLPVYRALDCQEWTPVPVLSHEFLRNQTAQAKASAANLQTEDVLKAPMSRLFFRHGGDEGPGTSTFGGAVGSIRMLRITSVFWGALALLASWLTLRRVLGCEQRALWFTALLAWTPQMQFLGGNLSMDLMVAALGCLALWSMVEWIAGKGKPWHWALAAGTCAALCSLTKLNGLVLLPTLALAAAFAGRHSRLDVKSLASAILAPCLVAGPYFVSGWLDTGKVLWMWSYQGISLYHNPAGFGGVEWDLAGVWSYVQTLFLTWFADFGWTAVWFSPWISLPIMVVMGSAGVIGCAWVLKEFQTPSNSDQPGKAGVEANAGPCRSGAMLFLLLAALVIQSAEVWFNLRFAQPQGRHLYPFLVAVIFPVAFGLERLGLLKPFAMLSLILSLAAFPLLDGRLRPAGWNESPGMAMTDEGRNPRPDLTATDATVLWLVDGQESVDLPIDEDDANSDGEPPALTWQVRPGHVYEVYFALGNPAMLDRAWRRDAILARASTFAGAALGGSFTMPASIWASLELGQVLDFQVVELTPAGQTAGYSVRRRMIR